MPNQETLKNLKHLFSLPQGGILLFYGVILAIIGFADLPAVDPGNFDLRKNLFAGNEALFPQPGSAFSVFKPYLPDSGAVSFLMDTPYHPYAPAAEQLYTAQSYLVPLVVNIDPIEKSAMVYCSNSSIADQWMHYAGYRSKTALAAGKCIAERIR